MLLLCFSGALIVGFVYNGKTSDGVDQFRNSVDDIQDDINSAYKMVRTALHANYTRDGFTGVCVGGGGMHFLDKGSAGGVAKFEIKSIFSIRKGIIPLPIPVPQ